MDAIAKARSARVLRLMYEIEREYGKPMVEAFASAVARIKSDAKLGRIRDALAAGNIEEAVRVSGAEALGASIVGVGVPPGSPSLSDHVLDAFRAGAGAGLEQMPKKIALAAKLDLTNPESTRWARERSAELVVDVTARQEAAIRAVITRAFEQGMTVDQVARRVRDSIGLTENQAEYVMNFRHQLETGRMLNATAPWDRRLNAVERREARDIYDVGGSVTDVNDIVGRYAERLVNRRALDIARTEIHDASINGQAEIFRQASDSGLIDKGRVKRFWNYTNDGRQRDTHESVSTMNPDGVGLDEPFNTPWGPAMNPGDGPAEEAINCRCFLTYVFD